MKFGFVFSSYALKQLKALPVSDQTRIKKKLTYWSQLPNPLQFAKALIHFEPATHRFRIGDYRVICRAEKNELVILVLKIGHRKDVYQK